MNTPPHPDWSELRTVSRPQAPILDTASIMDAIRQEATAHPLHSASRNPVAAIPTWACAMAASLAILAAAAVATHSVSAADRTISQAWMQDIEPEQFEANFLSYSATPREGNEI